MINFLFSKILHTVIVAFCVLTVVFGVLHLTGDPVMMLLPPNPSQEEIIAVTHNLGLDKPLHIQYWRFFYQVVHGDFGKSFQHKQPAMKMVAERLPASLLLTITGVCLAVIIALPLGIIAAIKRGSIIDNIAVAIAALGQSAPFFWIGLMLMLVLAVKLELLPTSGYGTWKHLIMPSITLATYPMAAIARLVRSSMLEVLGMDYIKTARSKGLHEVLVVLKHALKNASIPVVTMIGLQFGMLLGGSIVCEMIFAWPGVGRLIIFAIYNRDYPLVQSAVFVVAMVFVFCNLLVDICYAYLDPRVRVKS